MNIFTLHLCICQDSYTQGYYLTLEEAKAGADKILEHVKTHEDYYFIRDSCTLPESLVWKVSTEYVGFFPRHHALLCWDAEMENNRWLLITEDVIGETKLEVI